MSDSTTEYGIRVPGVDWPKGGVLLDGNTYDRAEQESRLRRYQDCWPQAELVQRTVARGPWVEAGDDAATGPTCDCGSPIPADQRKAYCSDRCRWDDQDHGSDGSDDGGEA
jgi:hypothetical protein